MIRTCTVSDAKLCDKVIRLNKQGWTVTKSEQLSEKVYKLYYETRARLLNVEIQKC